MLYLVVPNYSTWVRVYAMAVDALAPSTRPPHAKAAARGAARASAEAMAAAGPWQCSKDSVSADGFIQACAQGGDLIVVRAPLRTAAFFAGAHVHARLACGCKTFDEVVRPANAA